MYVISMCGFQMWERNCGRGCIFPPGEKEKRKREIHSSPPPLSLFFFESADGEGGGGRRRRRKRKGKTPTLSPLPSYPHFSGTIPTQRKSWCHNFSLYPRTSTASWVDHHRPPPIHFYCNSVPSLSTHCAGTKQPSWSVHLWHWLGLETGQGWEGHVGSSTSKSWLRRIGDRGRLASLCHPFFVSPSLSPQLFGDARKTVWTWCAALSFLSWEEEEEGKIERVDCTLHLSLILRRRRLMLRERGGGGEKGSF